MTKIVKCTCESKFQDETYGKTFRVANMMGSVVPKYRCTVCAKVH